MKKKISALLVVVMLVSLFSNVKLEANNSGGETPVNIALPSYGTTVETSHPNSWAEANGLGIANLNDGKTGVWDSFFITATSPDYMNEQMTVSTNFIKTYTVSKIVLYSARDGFFPQDFTLEVKTTGDTWVPVVTKTGYSSQYSGEGNNVANVFEFSAVDCSAVRLHTTKNGTNGTDYGVYLSEFEVYGVEKNNQNEETPVNIALPSYGTTAETSHSNSWAEANGLGIANLNDGKIGVWDSFFITATSPDYMSEPMTVSMNFTKTYTVSKIVLYSARDGLFPRDFTLEVKTSGDTWVPVVTKTGYSSQYSGEGNNVANVFEFSEVDCSAVRLHTTKNGTDGTNYGVYLSEFEVYGVEKRTQEEGILVNIALAENAAIPSTNCPDIWGEANGYGIANLNDGRTGEFDPYFITATDAGYQNKEMHVALKFKQEYKVSKAMLYARPEGAFPVDFRLEAYTASGWTPVVTKSGYSATTGWQEFAFDAVCCTGMRLVTTKNGINTEGKYAVYLGEFAVYGVESNTGVGDAPLEQPETPGETASNVALKSNGTTASTSHPDSWGVENGFDVDALIDGRADAQAKYFITTANEAYQNTEMRVGLSFQKAYKVDKVRLYATGDGGFPENFKLQAYTATGWKTVVTKENYTAQANTWQEFTFDAVDCSGVRLVSTKNGVNKDGKYAVYLTEFEVYGISSDATIGKAPAEKNVVPSTIKENVALASKGAVASTSHPDSWGEENGYGVGALNDGKAGLFDQYFITVASTAYQNEEMRVVIKLKRTYKVDKVRLYATAQGAFPKNFELQAYTASGWKTVMTKKNYTAKANTWQEFEFEAVDCTGIRLVSTKNTKNTDGKYAIYLGEFEVYGIESNVKISGAPAEKSVVSTTATTTRENNSNQNVYNADKNLALYMPATCSSDYETYGLGVSKVNDGGLSGGSFWSTNLLKSSKDSKEWVEINLLNNYFIDTVILYARDFGWGFPKDFKISVFYDDEWIEVVNKKNYSITEVAASTPQVFKFPAVVGNKVRVEGTNFIKADGEYGMQLMEVVVYGEEAIGDYVLPNDNIVSASTGITASTTLEDYGYFVQFLIDGDLASGYSSAQYTTQNHEEWIEMDFKREMHMGSILLKPSWGGNGFPTDFEVQILQDGKWVTAVSMRDYEKPVDEAWQSFVFDKQYVAQKLRIVATKLGEDFGKYCMKFNEIEVYPYEADIDNLGAVEVVDSKRSEYNMAEVVESTSTNSSVPMEWLFSGGLLIILAMGAIVVLYVTTIKKLKVHGNNVDKNNTEE